MKKFKDFLYESKESLAVEIFDFLKDHANLNPNWDLEYDEEIEKFASPDASELFAFAEALQKNIIGGFP